eukprot:520420-Rhodomonas_salina.2
MPGDDPNHAGSLKEEGEEGGHSSGIGDNGLRGRGVSLLRGSPGIGEVGGSEGGHTEADAMTRMMLGSRNLESRKVIGSRVQGLRSGRGVKGQALGSACQAGVGSTTAGARVLALIQGLGSRVECQPVSRVYGLGFRIQGPVSRV